MRANALCHAALLCLLVEVGVDLVHATGKALVGRILSTKESGKGGVGE